MPWVTYHINLCNPLVKGFLESFELKDFESGRKQRHKYDTLSWHEHDAIVNQSSSFCCALFRIEKLFE